MKLTRPLALALTAALLCACSPDLAGPRGDDPVEPVRDPEPAVRVDWSRLEEPPFLVSDLDAGRWYPYAVEDLIPSGDYGPLCPYVGTGVTSVQRWTDENGEEQAWTYPWSTPIYGLMTRAGKIVTDPVYQSVYQPTYRYAGEVCCHPVYLLGRTDPAWNDGEVTNGLRYAVAALDGSWCTGFDYWTYTLNGEGLLLAGPEGITKLDPYAGECTVWTWEGLGIAADSVASTLEELIWVYGFQWTDAGVFLGFAGAENAQVRLFSPEDGSISLIDQAAWDEILSAHIQRNWDTPKDYDYVRDLDNVTVTRGGEVYTLPIPEELNILHELEVNGDYALLQDYSGEGKCWLYRLSDAALVAQGSFISFLTDAADPDAPAFIRVEEALRSTQTLYSPDFIPFLTVDYGVYFTYHNGLITARDDETFFACYDAETMDLIFYRNLGLGG